MYEPAASDVNVNAPLELVVSVPVAVPLRARVIPGIHTSDASFCSSPSVSIHTVPAIAPVDAAVTVLGVVNERMIPFAVPFVFVMVTRK